MNISLIYDKQSGILKSALIMLFISDIATMGYIYRSYYGRTILNEIGADTQKNWKYNTETHQYSLKTEGDLETERKIDELRTDYNSAKIDKLRREMRK